MWDRDFFENFFFRRVASEDYLATEIAISHRLNFRCS